jgi:uncharacterized phage protein (TIGR01671 family)
MNRELKFRIWDKQNKKWIENSSSLHCYSNWTICPFTGNLVDYVGDFSCNSFTSSAATDYYWQGTTIIKEPRYIIQQYTGLQDCDGKEIYEGDVILNDEDKEIVRWGFCGWLCGNESFADLDMRRVKIIGNVFDNPELIKNNE